MKTPATTAQIITAIDMLSFDKRRGLMRAAEAFIPGTGFPCGCDLFHEALLRILDGRRKWPTCIRFDFFVYRTMDSIAHAERKRHLAERQLCAAFDDTLYPIEGLRCPSPTPEQAAVVAEDLRLAMRAAARARMCLRTESDRALLDEMLEGKSADEIKNALGLSTREYDLGRQRVVDRLRTAGVAVGANPRPRSPR
ncbi:hypothetical protein [Burkholderia glumae]|uniref:hypothetical protein n=1 Tax=Burkholderia glumae TaxID=337 RepID=UPI0003727013|nr:hypothetical protein [Burkholderia glumae]PJO24282.1 hypothetical protein Y5A_003875 [Burkholderia glumae AU6208]QHE11529.1 hypothetical protein GQR88_14615 [Burkholderia glumae AU6208]